MAQSHYSRDSINEQIVLVDIIGLLTCLLSEDLLRIDEPKIRRGVLNREKFMNDRKVFVNSEPSNNTYGYGRSDTK